MPILELSFESGEDSLSVRKFQINESMSSLFDVSIVARSPNEDIDLESLVGKAAGFAMVDQLMNGRAWTGIVAEMEQLRAEAPTSAGPGLSTYFLRIVPVMWLLTQRSNNRIFQKMSSVAIVQKILSEYGITPKLKLAESHPEHEYRVQYGETDFAFVSRLLEEEGISYYFGQTGDKNGLKSELVLADKPQTGEARPPIVFADNPNEAAGLDFVSSVHISHRVRPGKATHRDYDFEKPDYYLVGASEKSKAPEDLYEQYVYEHGIFTDEKVGKTRADIHIESHRRDKRSVSYHSNVFALSPGVLFSMLDHPRPDLAPDKKLLVIDASLEGSATGEYTLSGHAVFAESAYRPAQKTRKPVIHGLQSAIVVGPKGEEIHTDEHGRVRVQFHWDREGKYDDKSSCFIRVSHGWAGAAYGMFALPRVGHEVLIAFWEGNPDEPVIVGRAYNQKMRVPYKLPDEKTKSTWRTDSSPNSNGFNEIMFEDKAGRELVYIQAQKDLNKLVKHNESERTGANRTVIVGANRNSVIGANDSTLVGAKYSVSMVTPKELNILKGGDPDVSPTTTMIEMVDGKITLTTGKATVELNGKDILLKADGDINLKAGGDVVIHGGPFVKINC
ncbi:MAG: type VI secretion system tip protein VgrG [Polyangiaceae bacterium]|nr:type VI secretion system tip protein VgrG [Polyangiaceae bacterium]